MTRHDTSAGPIATSIFRLADSMVLFAVRQTDRGPEPLFTEVSGAPTAVAYTDQAEIDRIKPNGYAVFQVQLSDFLAQLPAGIGLVVDPHVPSPVYVAPGQRDAVLAAAWPFPTGAHITYGVPNDEPTTLLDCLATKSEGLPSVRRWWRAWYRVEDAREKLLLVYEADGTGEVLAANAKPVVAAAYECLGNVAYAKPGQVISLTDVPMDAQHWLMENLTPFYERAEL